MFSHYSSPNYSTDPVHTEYKTREMSTLIPTPMHEHSSRGIARVINSSVSSSTNLCYCGTKAHDPQRKIKMLLLNTKLTYFICNLCCKLKTKDTWIYNLVFIWDLFFFHSVYILLSETVSMKNIFLIFLQLDCRTKNRQD